MNLNELNQLRLDMIEAKRKFDTEANSYAASNCGIFIGDVVEVAGSAHRGKMMEVYKVGLTIDNWTGEYFADLHGSVLKKDVAISVNTAHTLVSLGKVAK